MSNVTDIRSNHARDNNINPDRNRIPLWFIITFSAVLLFTLSSFGLHIYQKQTRGKLDLQQESENYIQKFGILQEKDVIDTNWLHTLNPLVKKVQGRLLWSSNKQQGLMEFINLPKLEKKQKYILLIYDLDAENDAPVSAILKQQQSYQRKNKIIIPFVVPRKVKSPFKFELLLEEANNAVKQPLLLAQP